MSTNRIYTPLNDRVILCKPELSNLLITTESKEQATMHQVYTSGLKVFDSAVMKIKKDEYAVIDKDTLKGEFQIINIDGEDYYSIHYNRIVGKYSKPSN